jgi:ectoine hydroxylase-related dioxygenase (phytanoyl-CoA dioxygenase family)
MDHDHEYSPLKKQASSITPSRHWLSENAGDFDVFVESVSRQTTLADWPLATGVEQNALIYAGDQVNDAATDPVRRRALQAEWVEVLSNGPGVLVISAAFKDIAALDAASTLFETLIARQRNSDAQGGDHFAKPGANDRIWNAFEKHCLEDPAGFCNYYDNPTIALASDAWLGRGYQITAQVNRVNPGGDAQRAHRDYHLGFMSAAQMTAFPAHVHKLSPVLTLQGAIAHCDMPLETGPTLYLPYSQTFEHGYLAYQRDEYQHYFEQHRSQLPLKKGDVVFFNPALMHAAGSNQTSDRYRLANLLQVSSAFGRAMESVNHTRMLNAIYPMLQEAQRNGQQARLQRLIAATADGYPFPANLDKVQPGDSIAPLTQADHVAACVTNGMDATAFSEFLQQLDADRQA